jgi:hypothetical protein
MRSDSFVASSSGVRISNDFRDNLIIDRYDPMFVLMRASKIKHMRSENSEDAVTWNVFRSLRQIQPMIWLPKLASIGLPGRSLQIDEYISLDLWRTVAPPPGLLRFGDEGASEVDVIVESAQWVWFIEAKYHSDISTGTTTRRARDQVIRNIDVGSYYAGVRDFHFSLLVRSTEHSPLGAAAVARYCDLDVPRQELQSHRPDGLANLRSVTTLTWADLGRVFEHAQQSASRSDEQGYAQRAIGWLRNKGLLDV